ncbi:MAG: zf-TFIIB domain-containing protein [Candidatus Helarchaeales archaeon]
MLRCPHCGGIWFEVKELTSFVEYSYGDFYPIPACTSSKRFSFTCRKKLKYKCEDCGNEYEFDELIQDSDYVMPDTTAYYGIIVKDVTTNDDDTVSNNSF